MYRSCPGTTVARSQGGGVMVHLLLVLLAALHCSQAIYFFIYVEHIRLNKHNNGMPQLTAKKHHLKGLRENDSKSKASSLYHL